MNFLFMVSPSIAGHGAGPEHADGASIRSRRCSADARSPCVSWWRLLQEFEGLGCRGQRSKMSMNSGVLEIQLGSPLPLPAFGLQLRHQAPRPSCTTSETLGGSAPRHWLAGERRPQSRLFFSAFLSEIACVERQGGLASSTLRLLQPPRLSQ
jgi:hypothetical protein